MNQSQRRKRPRHKQMYFAIWLGKPYAAMLLTTTASAQVARRKVQRIRTLDGDAFYSREVGPIVPLHNAGGWSILPENVLGDDQ